MKIIVGLGNPGKKYEHTRHNTGWLILDRFILDKEAEKTFLAGPGLGNAKWEERSNYQFLKTTIENREVYFVKPKTFMNDSGKAVKAMCDFYKTKSRTGSETTGTGIDASKDLLIIHDDTDLPLSTVRTTTSASSAGHQGVESVIGALGSQDFHRIRIGVETRVARGEIPTDAFVLQNFTDDELKKLQEEIFPKVKLEIEKFLNK